MPRRFLYCILALCCSARAENACPQRDKIGQLLFVGLPSEATYHAKSGGNDEFVRFKNTLKEIGGVFLLGHNVRNGVENCLSKTEIKDMISALKQSNADLFVAVDQEGGSVQTFRSCNGFTEEPAAQVVGGSPLAEQTATTIATELKSVGVNWIFGPSFDVADPQHASMIAQQGRSYGSDPQVVSKNARIAVDAFKKAGLISTAKHFPGQGEALGNSHQTEAFLNQDLKTLESRDLQPFREVAADVVMTGHIVLPKIYGKNSEPASLNRNAIQKLLRGKLGFKGVVMTDDLDMRAISTKNSATEAAKKALLAGNDLLLFRISNPNSIIEGLCRQLANKNSSALAKRIDESFARVQTLKKKVQ